MVDVVGLIKEQVNINGCLNLDAERTRILIRLLEKVDRHINECESLVATLKTIIKLQEPHV